MGTPIKCSRLWFPKQVCTSSVEEEVRFALLGWASVRDKSVDVVVAAVCPVLNFSSVVIGQLQEVLDAAETKLPPTVRAERKLSVIGQYFVSPNHHSINNEDHEEAGPGDDKGRVKEEGIDFETSIVSGASAQRSFQLAEKDEGFDSAKGLRGISKVWAVVSAQISRENSDEVEWVPYLCSLSLEGCPVFVNDHTIIYQQPMFGGHHFSSIPSTPSDKLSSQTSSIRKGKNTFKRPQWLTALEQQPEAPDVEMVIFELNCATYFDGILKDLCPLADFSQKHSTVSSIWCDYFWRPVAAVMAIWATMLYALVQGLELVMTIWLQAFPYLGNWLQRSLTWQTLHIKCQQLMAWPFILQWGGLGPELPNAAIAHQVAIKRHSTWFALLIDGILGAITGFFLLKHHASIKQLVLLTGQIFTNDVLRTGCVWLMGVPAGFKLNNELAAAIGTLSLHVIQSWSTLFYTLVPGIEAFLLVLGISSFLLGFTGSAAILSDLVSLSTLHVSCLHRMFAFLHTNQLQALAALWRLFRGRKRNSLRGRLDTFDCSVEQLVVGSLMFTPLLLLLPTISVYYTYFSMIFLTLSTVQVMLHSLIAMFHCFPFFLVATWIIRPKRFPFGVWFQFPEPACSANECQGPLLSMLGSETASFAEILKPFMRSLWATAEWSTAASLVYKVVSGERYSIKLRIGNLPPLPHASVSLMSFAWLCWRASRSI